MEFSKPSKRLKEPLKQGPKINLMPREINPHKKYEERKLSWLNSLYEKFSKESLKIKRSFNELKDKLELFRGEINLEYIENIADSPSTNDLNILRKAFSINNSEEKKLYSINKKISDIKELIKNLKNTKKELESNLSIFEKACESSSGLQQDMDKILSEKKNEFILKIQKAEEEIEKHQRSIEKYINDLSTNYDEKTQRLVLILEFLKRQRAELNLSTLSLKTEIKKNEEKLKSLQDAINVSGNLGASASIFLNQINEKHDIIENQKDKLTDIHLKNLNIGEMIQLIEQRIDFYKKIKGKIKLEQKPGQVAKGPNLAHEAKTGQQDAKTKEVNESFLITKDFLNYWDEFINSNPELSEVVKDKKIDRIAFCELSKVKISTEETSTEETSTKEISININRYEKIDNLINFLFKYYYYNKGISKETSFAKEEFSHLIEKFVLSLKEKNNIKFEQEKIDNLVQETLKRKEWWLNEVIQEWNKYAKETLKRDDLIIQEDDNRVKECKVGMLSKYEFKDLEDLKINLFNLLQIIFGLRGIKVPEKSVNKFIEDVIKENTIKEDENKPDEKEEQLEIKNTHIRSVPLSRVQEKVEIRLKPEKTKREEVNIDEFLLEAEEYLVLWNEFIANEINEFIGDKKEIKIYDLFMTGQTKIMKSMLVEEFFLEITKYYCHYGKFSKEQEKTIKLIIINLFNKFLGFLNRKMNIELTGNIDNISDKISSVIEKEIGRQNEEIKTGDAGGIAKMERKKFALFTSDEIITMWNKFIKQSKELKKLADPTKDLTKIKDDDMLIIKLKDFEDGLRDTERIEEEQKILNNEKRYIFNDPEDIKNAIWYGHFDDRLSKNPKDLWIKRGYTKILYEFIENVIKPQIYGKNRQQRNR